MLVKYCFDIFRQFFCKSSHTLFFVNLAIPFQYECSYYQGCFLIDVLRNLSKHGFGMENNS